MLVRRDLSIKFSKPGFNQGGCRSRYLPSTTPSFAHRDLFNFPAFLIGVINLVISRGLFPPRSSCCPVWKIDIQKPLEITCGCPFAQHVRVVSWMGTLLLDCTISIAGRVTGEAGRTDKAKDVPAEYSFKPPVLPYWTSHVSA
jgi:hypothetical protein